jgi:hypothetical protein
MSDAIPSDTLAPFTRTCQIIVAALVMGVVSFLVVVLLFVPKSMMLAPVLAEAGPAGAAAPAPPPAGLPIISYIALAMAVSVLVLSFVVPKLIVSNARSQIAKGTAPKTGKAEEAEAAEFLPVYQTQLIIGAALLEGGAFFAAIAYMLERSPLALVAAGVLLGLLVTRFPTTERVRAWIEKQLELLQQQRQAIL